MHLLLGALISDPQPDVVQYSLHSRWVIPLGIDCCEVTHFIVVVLDGNAVSIVDRSQPIQTIIFIQYVY